MLRSVVKRTLLLGSGLGVGGGAVYIAADPEQREQIRGYYGASYRIYNLVATTAHIAYDYKFNSNSSRDSQATAKQQKDRLEAAFNESQHQQEQCVIEYHRLKNANESTKEISEKMEINRLVLSKISDEIAAIEDAANAQLSAAHTRNGKRLTQMCAENEGIYIKLGQHLSMLDYIVPVEYQQELSRLLANNLQSTWEEVQTVLDEDVGMNNIGKFFTYIEPKPIASASLAQVHIGVGVDGKKYALKIQHKDLREESVFDRKAVSFVVNQLSRIFPEFQYLWLVREMNKNIPLELDFKNELSNIKACRACLKPLIQGESVRIPDTLDHLCSERVLVMSYEEGCYVTDLKGIRKAGLNPSDISKVISTIFSEQT
jgi:predicted unusual protein kinase regulating ubiquinone biosynthesis (AarF/ABC1/UbiB family)